MAAPIRFLSGRQQQQKIGIIGSSEDDKVLEVIGRVGIGTTIFDADYNIDLRGDIRLGEKLFDSQTSPSHGSDGQVLISTGIGVSWSDSSLGRQDITDQEASTTYYFSAVDGLSGFSTSKFVKDDIVIKDGVVGIGSTIPSTSVKLDVGGNINIGDRSGNIATIFGPENIIIDPLPIGVGTTSGIVRIKGDLYVDGTQFIVASETITLADFVVGIASTVPTNILLDGAGIGIGSAESGVSLKYNFSKDTLDSEIGFGVSSDSQYYIGNDSVLTKDTLGTGVTISSIRSVDPGLISDRDEVSASSDDFILYYDSSEGFLKKSTIENAALQGIQGIRGAQGIQGITGDQGLQGIQGITGDQGLQGITGDQGLQGIQGITGDQGTQGIQGITGDQGVQGTGGTSVTITDDTTTNATRYIAFSDQTSGTLSDGYVSSTKLQYNPSTGTVFVDGAVEIGADDSETQKFSIQYNETTDSLDFVYSS